MLALWALPTPAAPQQAGLSSYFESTHGGGPVDITGKSFVYDYKTDEFVVTGDAVVTQFESVLSADRIDLMRRDKVVHATDNVHIVDPLGEIRARSASLNLSDETGELIDATVTNKQKTYVLKGSKIQKSSGQRYRIFNGFFTTCGCDPGTPDWSITGDRMDVHLGSSGTAHNGYFDVLGHPVIYLPFAVFPADTDRHSGFLGPRLGQSGLRGFQWLQPYFWAINKSSDATFALDLETSQRVGGLAEYRLITGVGDYFIIDGGFYDESLRSQHNRISDIIDTQLASPTIPVDRYDLFSMVREHVTPDLTLYGDAITVSDSLLLRELNVWTLSRNVQPGISYPTGIPTLREAMSDWGALYDYSDGFARLQGVWHQDLIQPQEFALQTLPELLFSGRKDLMGGLLYADYDVQGDNFWRANGQSGQRLDLNPRLTLPWRLGDYLYGFGTVGVRETLYDVSKRIIEVNPVGTEGRIFNNGLDLGPLGSGGFRSREMFYAGAGVASEVEKIYDFNALGISQLKHTIEPFATFAYVPRINQSDLPLFDQVDRIEARSLITYGVTSRFYAKVTRASTPDVSEDDQPADDEASYSLSPFQSRSSRSGSSVIEVLRFTLLQAYDSNHAVAKGSSRFADLDMAASLFPSSVLSMNGILGYSPVSNGISNASAFVNFQPWWTSNRPKLYMGRAESGSFLQIRYDYIAPGPTTKQPGQSANLTQFLTARAYYDLFDRMGLYFAPSYDFVKNKIMSAEYGVRIKSPCDCWSFDMGITKTINPSETQYQFQVTLGGLGSIGQSPFGRNPFQTRIGVLPNYQ